MYNYNCFLNNSFRNSSRQNNTTMNTPPLFTPQIGFNNGNLFSNLYSQYRDYKPTTLNGLNEKTNLLLDISRMGFAAHDLNLYLDNYPNDVTMIMLFNDYKNKSDKLIQEYESKYGPLTISGLISNQSPFSWENDAWPWEEKFYV